MSNIDPPPFPPQDEREAGDLGGGRILLPDAVDAPDLYDNITTKRVLAYCLDVIILTFIAAILWFCALVLGFLTFGLASGLILPLLPLIPAIYHTGLIGGARHATFGMRLMGLEVRTIADDSPAYLHAFLMTALFYLSLMMPIVLIFAFFNSRQRLLHDIFSGTVVVNSAANAARS